MNKNTITLNSIVLPITAALMVSPIAGIAQKAATFPDKGIETDIIIKQKRIDRVKVLENFFDKYKSPLKDNAKTFVDVADKYGIDYKLLPAISCMESSCGKKLIANSYNPFGWGIYGRNAIYFNNYDDAIETVGKGIAEKYISRGFDSVKKIAPIYTPPNSNHWESGVSYFIAKIGEEEVRL